MNSASKFKAQAVLLLLVPLMIFFLLIIPVSAHGSGRVMHAWWDFTHVPAFFFITWLLLILFHRWRMLIWPAMFAVVPVIEWVQGFTGREQAMPDIIYGWVGCLAGGLLAAAPSSSGFLHVANRVIAATLIMLAMTYPLRLWLEDARVHRMFPVVSAFDSSLEKSRWSINGCEIKSTKDGWEITIKDKTDYPGLFLKDRVSDWSAMAGLSIQVYLEGDRPLEMWVRVDDLRDNPSYFNRFQKPVILQPGPNTVILERNAVEIATGGRKMDLGEIHAFGMFFSRQDTGRVIRLTQVRILLDEG